MHTFPSCPFVFVTHHPCTCLSLTHLPQNIYAYPLIRSRFPSSFSISPPHTHKRAYLYIHFAQKHSCLFAYVLNLHPSPSIILLLLVHTTHATYTHIIYLGITHVGSVECASVLEEFVPGHMPWRVVKKDANASKKGV